MKNVGVLDTRKIPQNPVHPAMARRMLRNREAAIYRKHPFTIILKESVDTPLEPLRIKIDPGSRITGIAVVNDAVSEIVWAGELKHRGHEIKDALEKRRALRRARRNRNTRYRPARFNNRRRKEGWLPPSLMSRVYNVQTWVKRLCATFPIQSISVEIARFDTQLMDNPDITGVEYQQGELAGYEVREYLLEKFGRKCVYCGKTDIPMEIEHITPKSRGGSNRISNLAISCRSCNVKKGNKTAEEFGHSEVQVKAKMSLRDAAMMNATRYKTLDVLQEFGLPIETGTGGRTKYNRIRAGLDKSHWADAVCVGASTPESWRPVKGAIHSIRPKSYARRGRRQACLVDKFGFPRTKGKSGVRFNGYQTGDIVKVDVKQGKLVGTYKGRLSAQSGARFTFYPKKKGLPSGAKYADIVKLIDRDGSYEYSYKSVI